MPNPAVTSEQLTLAYLVGWISLFDFAKCVVLNAAVILHQALS